MEGQAENAKTPEIAEIKEINSLRADFTIVEEFEGEKEKVYLFLSPLNSSTIVKSARRLGNQGNQGNQGKYNLHSKRDEKGLIGKDVFYFSE